MIAHKLKELQTRKAKVEAELDRLMAEKNEAHSAWASAKNRLNAIESEIASLMQTNTDPVVTEHALLRYFERVLGFDLNNVKREILDNGRGQAIKALGSGKIPFSSATLIVKGGTVVSIS